jgi:hypothetical protein
MPFQLSRRNILYAHRARIYQDTISSQYFSFKIFLVSEVENKHSSSFRIKYVEYFLPVLQVQISIKCLSSISDSISRCKIPSWCSRFEHPDVKAFAGVSGSKIQM